MKRGLRVWIVQAVATALRVPVKVTEEVVEVVKRKRKRVGNAEEVKVKEDER